MKKTASTKPFLRDSDLDPTTSRLLASILAEEGPPTSGDEQQQAGVGKSLEVITPNNNNNSNSALQVQQPSSSISISSNDNDEQGPQEEGFRRFQTEAYVLVKAALIGVASGSAVGAFKWAIDAVRQESYGLDVLSSHYPVLVPLIPAVGGLAVAALTVPGPFSPGLRQTVVQVDQASMSMTSSASSSSNDTSLIDTTSPLPFVRKTAAAVCTLGTGNSLGPEGPAVEIGLRLARAATNIFPPSTSTDLVRRNRLLLACGASAGFAAGFNAPLAATFFSLEILQGAFYSIDEERQEQQQEEDNNNGSSSNNNSSIVQDASIKTTSLNIASVLLASVLSALTAQHLFGNHLVLKLSQYYDLQTPLTELPFYLVLGVGAGLVSYGFSQTAKLSKSFFQGRVGPEFLQDLLGQRLPKAAKPVLGGLFCGLVGLAFPQILFFGYGTLNALLANEAMSTMLLLSLLLTKIVATAVATGSGLVGGTFAPSLFLGALMGAALHNVAQAAMQLGDLHWGLPVYELADVAAYSMVGAGSVLAALFRAPLTATLLMFELTRNYESILPLMAAAGVGSVVADILEAVTERAAGEETSQEYSWGDMLLARHNHDVDHHHHHIMRRDHDSVSWGDLADSDDGYYRSSWYSATKQQQQRSLEEQTKE